MKAIVTNNQGSLWQSKVLPYFIPIVLGVFFFFLTFQSSSNSGISLPIQLSIIIPEVLIWLIASVGAFQFKKYASAISGHPDGRALNQIANALLLLVVYIILLTTIGAVANLFEGSKYQLTAVFLQNHLPIVFALASAILLLKGSTKLVKVADSTLWTKRSSGLLLGSSLLFFAVFGYVFYAAQPNQTFVDGIPQFALPAEALLFTYILPHVILWLAGLKACINLSVYASRVPGVLYKSLFKDLYRGILMTFICIFAAQFIIITTSAITRLNFVLGAIYAVLILAMVGFVLILRGTRKLAKVEHAL